MIAYLRAKRRELAFSLNFLPFYLFYFSFLGCSLVRLDARSFVPTRAAQSAARAGAVKVGRHAGGEAGADVSRPYLDGSKHDARLGVCRSEQGWCSLS